MTKKEQYWSEHLAAVSAENMNTKAYAEREGLSAASLYYWRKRVRPTASGQSGTGQSTRRKRVPVQGGRVQPAVSDLHADTDTDTGDSPRTGAAA